MITRAFDPARGLGCDLSEAERLMRCDQIRALAGHEHAR